MFAKILIVTAVASAYLQAGGRADGDVGSPSDGRRTLDADIAKMKGKVNASVEMIESAVSATEAILAKYGARPVGGNDETRERCTSFWTNVIDRTVDHYDDVAAKATAGRRLNYTSPFIYALKLVSEDRDVPIETMQKIVSGSDRFDDDDARRKVAALWTDAINIYMDGLDGTYAIAERYPDEFAAIEDANGWQRIDRPMPPDSSPEVLRVSEKLVALLSPKVNELGKVFDEMRRFERVAAKRGA